MQEQHEQQQQQHGQALPGGTAWFPQGLVTTELGGSPVLGGGGAEADDEREAAVSGPEPCGAVRDLFAARRSSDGFRRVGSSTRLPDVDLTEVCWGMDLLDFWSLPCVKVGAWRVGSCMYWYCLDCGKGGMNDGATKRPRTVVSWPPGCYISSICVVINASVSRAAASFHVVHTLCCCTISHPFQCSKVVYVYGIPYLVQDPLANAYLQHCRCMHYPYRLYGCHSCAS
jgi:hypothetical protein